MGVYHDIVGRRGHMGAVDIMGGHSPTLEALFSGGGGLLVVGANGQAAPPAVQQAAMRELAMRNASGLVDLEPTKSRRYPLGFPTTTVTAASTAVTSAQPQIPFRGERLVVPSDFAGDLNITDIKVGKNSQLAAANPLPARAFTEQGWGIEMHLDTADVSQFISLNLANTSGQDIIFNAMLLGRAVE